MLLTLFAIVVGSGIGRKRGGRRSGVAKAQLRFPPLLVIAIATVLVQAVLDPVFPFVWSLVSVSSFIAFAILNRHLTGMSIMLIGALLNVIVMIFNGATPVSELALVSVGDLNAFDQPDITGARESSETATRLSFLGDAIPVPFFGTVVSIGDLIGLVGLADVFTNLFLDGRKRELSLTDAGVYFGDAAATEEKVSILSPLQTAGRSGDRRPLRPQRRKEAPTSHVPAHAASIEADETSTSGHVPAHAVATELDDLDPEPTGTAASSSPQHVGEGQVINLTDSVPAHADADDPILLAGLQAVPVTPATVAGGAADAPVEEVVEVIDLTDPDDPRPIIDLTTSPTDEQMTEFLRRRKAADRDFGQVAVRPAGQRRGRAPVRLRTDERQGVVEAQS